MLNPEHLHLALNHVAFLGSGFAILPIAIGAYLRNRALWTTGLIMAIASGALMPLVMESGEGAYERYEDGPVASYLDEGAEEALEHHEHRAEAWGWVLLANAGVAALATVLSFWNQRIGRIAAFVSIATCLCALFVGTWIAQSGGEIRRPDFRSESP